MCLASVYECNKEGVACDEPALSDVTYIEARDEGYLATQMLGKSEMFQGKLRSVDFVEGKVFLQRIET